MSIEKVIIELEYLNAWRRDFSGKIEQPNATQVGETIDEAIKLLKQQKNGITIQKR